RPSAARFAGACPRESPAFGRFAAPSGSPQARQPALAFFRPLRRRPFVSRLQTRRRRWEEPMGVLVPLLAVVASRSGGIGLQPRIADRLLAIDTDAILVVADSEQSGVDGLKLANVPVDDGQIEVHQQVRDG